MRAVVLALAVLTVATAMPQSRQSAHRLDATVTFEAKLSYLLYLPKGYGDDPAKLWPLVLFLHGAGESGADLDKVKTHGPPKLVEQGKEFPCVIVSPQCASVGDWWPTTPLLALLDEAQRTLRIDPDRVTVTGLSMGGYGSWALACATPERFAGAAPVCGGGVPRLAGRMAKMGVWAFHGAKDAVVPLEESQRMVDALRAAGGSPRFTVYPDAGHDSWTQTYDDPAFWDWLLAQKRKGR